LLTRDAQGLCEHLAAKCKWFQPPPRQEIRDLERRIESFDQKKFDREVLDIMLTQAIQYYEQWGDANDKQKLEGYKKMLAAGESGSSDESADSEQ
jgi:hypothetical protein